jgi:hypothetical protein
VTDSINRSRRLGFDVNHAFARSAGGSVAVQAALLLLLVMGFLALGLESTSLLLEQRKQQAVADSAAMAAASAVKLGVTDLQGEARAVSAQLGYKSGVGGVTVTAVNPPATGPHTGDANYVEVKVQRTFMPVLTRLFRPGAVTVVARAVASTGAGGDSAAGSSICALVLESTSADAVKLDNTGKITLPSCGLQVNSTSNTAVRMYNNSKIDGNLMVGGDVSIINSASITGTVTKQTPAGTDPYASVVLPSATTATMPSLTNGNQKVTLDPGIYTGGWNFWGSQDVTLNPGVYFVRSSLGISGNVTLTGTGVTIVVDGNYAINMNGSTALTLTAPTSGATKGIAIYSNQSTTSQQFTNNGTLKITGALYFPKQTVEFNNSATNNSASNCTQLIARKIYMTNAANLVLKSSCAGTGVSQLGTSSGPAGLAE